MPRKKKEPTNFIQTKKESEQILPNSASDFIRQVREESNTIEDPQIRKELRLASLAEMEGWKIVKELVTERIDRVKNLRDVEDIYNMSENEVGKRFITASLVAEQLQWVVDLVEAPAKYHAEKKSTEQ